MPRGVSITARSVAVARGRLTRPERPTGDAAAEARLYRSLGGVPWDAIGAMWEGHMRPRTAFFDEAVLGAIDRGVTQIVTIGAGYDGRALRFRTPGVTFFEVDHPHTQADKRRRIAAAGGSEDGITFVTVDLAVDALGPALGAAGHDASAESLFLAEGLLTYLTDDEIAQLLDAVHAYPGRLAVTAVEAGARPPVLTQVIGTVVRHTVSLLGEPMRTRARAGTTERLLTEHGFTVLRSNCSDESGFLSLQFEASV